jgi:hypothetical protein
MPSTFQLNKLDATLANNVHTSSLMTKNEYDETIERKHMTDMKREKQNMALAMALAARPKRPYQKDKDSSGVR